MTQSQLAFEPYLRYRRNRDDIRDFWQLTKLAYGVTLQLLFKYPKEQLPHIALPEDTGGEISYGMHEREIQSVELACGWLTFVEYAEHCGLDPELVEIQAREGKLGSVERHPMTDREVIVWPPEMQDNPRSELPEPGEYTMRVKSEESALISTELELEDYERTQQTFLSLAHSLGESEEVAERAQESLHRSCFLLHWVIFEVFLRSTVHQLIKRHPRKLTSTKKGKKPTLSYEDILAMSRNLSSVDSLRESLTDREIERQQADGASVHGLINFLKSAFNFERDPYEAWYVLEGERRETHYLDLMELKDVRNALLHDGGTASESFFEEYPEVRRRKNDIVVDADYYLRSSLILDSIAYGIAESIDRERYDTGA